MGHRRLVPIRRRHYADFFHSEIDQMSRPTGALNTSRYYESEATRIHSEVKAAFKAHQALSSTSVAGVTLPLEICDMVAGYLSPAVFDSIGSGESHVHGDTTASYTVPFHVAQALQPALSPADSNSDSD
jgi:hypothetical protein